MTNNTTPDYPELPPPTKTEQRLYSAAESFWDAASMRAYVDADRAARAVPDHIKRISIPTETMEQEFQKYYQRGFKAGRAALAGDVEPIDMVLHCPKCGMQHIDAVDPVVMPDGMFEGDDGWDNPPHRSHLCHFCRHIWRPADVPTNGVEAVKTTGKDDSPIAAPQAPASESAVPLLAKDHTSMRVDYRGLLRQCREGLRREPGNAEMLRQLEGHLTELGQRWYAGDIAVVDEILQLYCIESEARAALAASREGGAK